MTKEILAKIIDNTDAGLYVSDFYSGEILFVNESMSAIAGCTYSELIGKQCWSLIAWIPKSLTRKVIQQ